MKIAIIGAGLAGTSCAYALKNMGHEVEIYDAANTIANVASGNDLGLYNPRFTADKNAQSLFYETAFFKALETFEAIGADRIAWKQCGALHLMTDEKKQRRFPKTLKNWAWGEGEMRLVDAKTASGIAGIDIQYDALYLPRAGYVSPRELCHAYAADIPVHLNAKITNVDDIESDRIILACGIAVLGFDAAAHLPIKPVRGQVTQVQSNGALSGLKTNLCYGGYCTPDHDGAHMIGATFQRWLDHDDIIDDDDQDNIEKLSMIIPDIQNDLTVTDHRASVRVSSKDYMPVIGAINDRVYITAAHGSHGILSSLMAAQIIAAEINNDPAPVPDETLSLLNPLRFYNERFCAT